MREIKQTLYNINELSADAQAIAHQNWCDIQCGFEDLDITRDDIIELGNCLGINIDQVFYNGFGSQGDGLCVTGDYEYKPTWKANIEAYAPMAEQLFELGEALEKVNKEYCSFSVNITHGHGRYYHENSVDMDYSDDDLYEEIGENALNEVSDLLRKFMTYSYRLLENEYNYQNSMGYFIESSLANEYEYYQNGRQYF
jgi:hypothetical protein